MQAMSTAPHAEIEVAGELLWLLPDRAVYWPAKRTLLVADPHFDKAATFRLSGIPAPKGTTALALSRLDAMIGSCTPARIVFLGDFLHARRGRSSEVLSGLRLWRDRHSDLEMLLVRGSHDLRAGDPPPEVGITGVHGPLREEPFALVHHPMTVDGAYVLAGHVHPCITLRGKGRQHERLACFWMGWGVGVLPAFGEFTGCSPIRPVEGDRVYVVAEGAVVEAGDR